MVCFSNLQKWTAFVYYLSVCMLMHERAQMCKGHRPCEGQRTTRESKFRLPCGFQGLAARTFNHWVILSVHCLGWVHICILWFLGSLVCILASLKQTCKMLAMITILEVMLMSERQFGYSHHPESDSAHFSPLYWNMRVLNNWTRNIGNEWNCTIYDIDFTASTRGAFRECPLVIN